PDRRGTARHPHGPVRRGAEGLRADRLASGADTCRPTRLRGALNSMQTESPKYSVAAWMTPHNSVFDDIEQVARVGADGLGLFEGKFGDADDGAIKEALARSGLAPTFCIPSLWTFLVG